MPWLVMAQVFAAAGLLFWGICLTMINQLAEDTGSKRIGAILALVILIIAVILIVSI